MNRKEKAQCLFKDKFNCAQSVFAAFDEDIGIDRDTALKTAACFGSGLKCGEVCGAVTGALMAIGNRYGTCNPDDAEGKKAAYEKSLDMMSRFQEKHGTYLCKELLGYNPGNPEDMEKIRALGLHDTICLQAISDAVEIMESLLGL